MFRINSADEQKSMFSEENKWSNFQSRRIKKSWASFFHDEIFPNINEEPYRILYSSNNSTSPNTPVNILISLLIIKTMTDSTDEEIMDLFEFDQRVQYATHTLDLEKRPGSENSLNLFRRRLNAYYAETGEDLFENTMKELNEYIIKLSEIDLKLKRMDSMMISSSCKRLNRIELVYIVNYYMVKIMSKLGKNVKKFKHYLDKNDKVELLYKTKTTEENNKLDNLLKESITIYNRCKTDKDLNELDEFKHLQRLLNEQYDSNKKTPKSNDEIKSTSMQTPHDTDATFRFKYGPNVGYVGNIVEAVDDKKQLITDWEIAPNVTSDKTFMEHFIDNKNDETEETTIVDSAYYSDELKNKAKEKNITIHPTELVGKKVAENNLKDFEYDKENYQILKCPNNQKPIECKNKEDGTVVAKFNKEICNKCPFHEFCVVKKQKTQNKLETKISTIQRAQQSNLLNDPEYIKISNKRAGVEGIPSVMRRKYNVDNRPCKGQLRLKQIFSAAIIAININRMVKYSS